MQLFYNSIIDKETKEITFDKIESKHIIKVLRKKEGDRIFITNGKGELFNCIITIANDKRCLVSVSSQEEKKQPKDYYLHIVISPLKSNDRLEWFLEKATEIGIDEITPVICDNSERKVIKKERFDKIIQSAMKQSLQMQLPQLNEVISFKQFITQKFNGQTYIAHCEAQEKTQLNSLITPHENYTILIGPEGDFSLNEIELALQHSFKPVALGSSRLRTETAGIVACHTIALKNLN